jgi:hypothetical protein
LIRTARQSALPELNDRVAKLKAARSDPEARRAAIQAKRSLRRWTDRDGAFQARLYGHPQDGARLWTVLDPLRRRLNALRRQAGAGPDSFEALDYDAVMALAAIAAGQDGELGLADLLELGLFPQLDATMFAAPDPPPADPTSQPPPPPAPPGRRRRAKRLAGSPMRVMIRVDLDALFRGVPQDGELCEIARYGPVPVSVIQDLLASDNPFIIGILTRGQTLTGVYHHGRHPNSHQRSALDFLYPTCAASGCHSRAGLQYDHRADYAKTKITAFDLLDRLCPHHHSQKTRHNWALIDGRGKRPFVPPHDPRHPRHQQPEQTRAGPAP